MLRNATLRRAVASFFLLELGGSLAAPGLSYALTGPGQPEFTSYESAGSPDMVNLSTGDLTYNVPVLEVPGPEMNFSLPLTYRAGIRPEQDASWVGLGWSMNPGAIVRNVNGYPDDASGELATSSYTDPGHRGWYGGVPGLLTLGWDSETGHSGSASLLGLVSSSWSGGKLQSGDIIGIGATRGEGFGIDPGKLALGAATIASIGIGAAASAAHQGVALGIKQLAGQAAGQLAGQVGTGVGIAALGKLGPSGGGFMQPTINKDHTWFRTNYWVFVNDTTKEAMFGSLYFDRMKPDKSMEGEFGSPNYYGPDVYDGPANYQAGKARKGYKFNYSRTPSDQGNLALETSADMQQTKLPHVDYRESTLTPASIAHDDFSVMGPGISGNIRPQRLEVGSLAYPRQMLARHDKYYLVPWESYKVPFRYENSASNTYTYGANDNATTLSSPSPVGVDASHWNDHKLLLTDPKVYDAAQTTAAVRTEPNRKGLTNRRLAQGKQVSWYTNKEINDGYNATPFASPILEHTKITPQRIDREVLDRYDRVPIPGPDGTRPVYTYEPHYTIKTDTYNNYFRVTRPENGIGAFAITAEDGTTYHYSLPVYHLRQYSETRPTDGSNKGVATTGRGAKRNDVYSYATAWLLTAITSPDYVDQGDIGVVDAQDLGTWVKFSYGKFSGQYKWRQPYLGQQLNPSVPDATTLQEGAQPDNASFQEGAKETYYLNSITTRTHTALFIKSVRQDGRGHYTSGLAKAASNLGIDENTPASSLRLDEVVVLSNPDLATIQASTGFGENTSGNAASQNATLGGNDSFASVLDQNDVTANTAIRPALNQKALKRIVFNYSYRLCPGTSNSFASPTAPPPLPLGSTYSAAGRTGKLTLESIATYGPNSVKLIPDFRFDYGFNPAYDPVKCDGFGMYASTATTGYDNPSEDFALASRDAAAWSLTKITNPLGAVTEIIYERDQYASISEFPTGSYDMTQQSSNGSTTGPSGILQGSGKVDLTTLYKVGRTIHLRGFFTDIYRITQTSTNNTQPITRDVPCTYEVDADYYINNVSANTIGFTIPPAGPNPNGCIPQNTPGATYSGFTTGYSTYKVAIPVALNRNGGDLRVAAVSTRDEAGHAYSIKYKYTYEYPNANQTLYNSSGVISKEPEVIRYPETIRYRSLDIYKLFDYPATPVMYGKTTVLRGNFTTPEDIDQREEYEFYTATSSMVRPSSRQIETKTSQGWNIPNMRNDITLRQRSNSIAIDIGLLGQAKSIRKYNRRGTLEFSTVFNYAKSLPNADGIAGQGTFTEGGIISEFLDAFPEESDPDRIPCYNLNWTSKQYLPTTLLGTTTTTNNIAATTTNQRYDFYTGAVLETSLTNSLGDKYRSQTIPAYTRYPGMGPKTEVAGNAHMLTQTAATYAYKENGTATPAVLGAAIQTWNNTWATYRRYDPASDRYQSDPAASTPIWRQHRTYAWQSPRLNKDGSYASFVDYSWTQPTQMANWLNVGEVTLYDHYSRPLESKDLNGQYAAQKTGYDQGQAVAAAHNARYTEIAYAGAEDALTTGSSAGHFGGEVRDGGRQSADQAHTGQFSSLLTPANPLGFTYKAVVGDANDLSTKRTYRASAWVYNADPASLAANGARLYITLNGTTLKEVGPSDPSTKRAGKWYLLNCYVDLPATATGQPLVVGCRNAGTGNVYVDDFRFHPLDAPLQATVYDPATRQPTFTLDNDNLYTRYQYDAAGKVVKVYREVLSPAGSAVPAERLLKESSYNYAQMSAPNWLEEETVCATDAGGQTTGYLARKLRDVNTASPTYNQVKLETTNILSNDCPH